jgi:hypothetical protein
MAKLEAAKGSGKSKNDIAREFTKEPKDNFPKATSVVRHADGTLFSAARARRTFSRITSALAVQAKPLGLAL